MKNFEADQVINFLGISKKVDLVCKNEKECIIVCFLVTKRTPELVIISENSYYYIDMIEAQEELLNHKKKVTVLIIPLLMLNNFRLIEFDKEEVIQMQQNQEKNPYLQNNYIKSLENQLFNDVSLVLEQCELQQSEGKKTVYKFIKDLNKSSQSQFLDFNNIPQRYNPRDRECMSMTFCGATIQVQELFISKASKLLNNQLPITQYLNEQKTIQPTYQQELI